MGSGRQQARAMLGGGAGIGSMVQQTAKREYGGLDAAKVDTTAREAGPRAAQAAPLKGAGAGAA